MKWTNRHNLDPVITQAVQEESYEAVGDISVTRLVQPPQLVALEYQYADVLEQDVIDGLHMLEGQALHSVLAAVTAPNRLQEHRLIVDCQGWLISGQLDVLYEDGHVLKDYKYTTVWSWVYGGKTEWEMQVNFYAHLARCNDLRVDTLSIVMWFRDWERREVERTQSYPPLKVMEQVIPLMPDVQQVFEERVRLHQAARQGTYPPCSDSERWARPDTWAVTKPGAKRAYRVLTEQAMAEAMARTSGYVVEHRPGENIRCARYCPVVDYCEQAKSLGVVPVRS